jgi:hypothetical protein
MSTFEEVILQLAVEYNNPDEFVANLEKLPIQPNKKEAIFQEAGNILYYRSNFDLALSSWDKASMFYAEIKDKSGEANCYTCY